MDEPSPYGPGTRPPAEPVADTHQARSRSRFWLVAVLGMLVAPVVLAGVGIVNGFALGGTEPANAGLATTAFVAAPVVYVATWVFVLGTALQRGARRETIMAECFTLALAIVVPVGGYLLLFPPLPGPGPEVDSGTDYATSYSNDIMSSMSWSPEFIEAIGAARDRDALVAAIENYENPHAAGNSINYAFTYDVDVTALDRPRQGGLPGRGVLRVTVDVEAGRSQENGTDGWSAGTATNCSSFRVSATNGLHDLQPVDCAVADILPPEQPAEQPTPVPEPTQTSTKPSPTDPDTIRLLDVLSKLGPRATEDAAARAVTDGFPGSPVETDRSDDEIVVVVGEWEDCLVAVVPEDDPPFRFTGFDRILLTRGEMGCTPQLYLNPVATH